MNMTKMLKTKLNLKKCIKCENEKEMGMFHVGKNSCKLCRSFEEKVRYELNRSRIVNRLYKYAKENKESIKQKARERYKNNEAYREVCLEYGRKYRNENRERINKHIRDYRKTDIGRFKALVKNRKRELLERGVKFKGTHTLEDWNNVLKENNYSCVMCGTKKHITKDHIIPLIKGGSDKIENIQPLCRKCNSIKGKKIL